MSEGEPDDEAYVVPDDTWDCEAYGPEGTAIGVLCFFSEHGRKCRDQEQCHRDMTAERGRVFGRIHQLAATGDPVMKDLAEQFTRPEQLLGGGEGAVDDEQDDEHPQG